VSQSKNTDWSENNVVCGNVVFSLFQEVKDLKYSNTGIQLRLPYFSYSSVDSCLHISAIYSFE